MNVDVEQSLLERVLAYRVVSSDHDLFDNPSLRIVPVLRAQELCLSARVRQHEEDHNAPDGCQHAFDHKDPAPLVHHAGGRNAAQTSSKQTSEGSGHRSHGGLDTPPADELVAAVKLGVGVHDTWLDTGFEGAEEEAEEEEDGERADEGGCKGRHAEAEGDESEPYFGTKVLACHIGRTKDVSCDRPREQRRERRLWSVTWAYISKII